MGFNRLSENTRGFLMVVSAPSGTGKTTLCKRLLKVNPELRFSISYTTRPQRAREVDGRDYHFISEAIFGEKRRQGEFVETEEIFNNLYGTSGRDIESCLAAGQNMLFDVDTRGAKSIKKVYPEGVFVFILPPSLDVLKERLTRRGSEDEATMSIRLKRACDEIHENDWYDYVIINDMISSSFKALESIYIAEKSRRFRQLEMIKRVLQLKGGM